MVNGDMIKLKVLDNIFILMELSMKESGVLIYKMDKVLKLGLMDPYSKVYIVKVRKMELENMNGLMVLNIKVSGKKMKYQGMDIINGQMVGSM